MELRDHRLMSYRGVPNWPPVWLRRKSAAKQQTLRGEVGILQEVSIGIDYRRSILSMEHEGEPYIGCLIFSDHRFCRPIVKLLRRYCGHSIKDIGGIDLDRVLIRLL
jgi:hypothetical protein